MASEGEAIPVFRLDDPTRTIKKKLNQLTVLYLAIAFIGVVALAFPTSNRWNRLALDLLSIPVFVTLWGVKPVTEPLKRRFPNSMQLLIPNLPEKIGLLEHMEHLPQELKNQRSGLAAELRVAESVNKQFRNQRVKVFSRLNENCLVVPSSKDSKLKDVDVVAVFPNGQRFAISVKKRQDAKAVYIDEANQIRQSRKGSTLKMVDPDPADELIEQERWLRQHRRNLLLTPGVSVLMPSVRILVFAAPTIIGHKDWHEYITLGEKQYLKVSRGKDFVYLVQEDQICDFIEAILTRR